MSAGRTADPKNWREMRRLLRLNGARPVRVSGSHETWRFRDGESFTVVCNHLNDPVTAAMTALADVDELPGPADYVTSFHPGYVHVRRVPGFNLWILNRFGPTFLDVVTVRDAPPPPIDER